MTYFKYIKYLLTGKIFILIKNGIVLRYIRYVNKIYNYFFYINLKKNTIIKPRVPLHSEQIENREKGWLPQTGAFLNFSILHSIFKKNIHKNNFHFIDIGCGYGIAMIFSKFKFNFLSYSGIDFDPECIRICKQNLLLNQQSKEIMVNINDASNFLLEDKKYFIYLFNPFNSSILLNFLKNNIKNIKKNESVIAYNIDRHLDVIKEFKPKKINSNKYRYISLIFF